MKQTLTTEAMQEIYEAAVHSEASGSQEAEFELLCKLEDVGGTGATIRKLIDMVRAVNRGAQPVLYASEETLAYAKEGEKSLVTWSEPMGDAVIPLFTAPLAPAVPNEMPDAAYAVLSKACGDNACLFADELWSACRAAMLAAAPEGGNEK